ncbi:MAG TPA: aspartate/glutamate racemase family protein [Xanthobacteraceae bacterium]|nr:aspartate/glutamate racemase family protein [Xanthobacteraceae bacterium]
MTPIRVAIISPSALASAGPVPAVFQELWPEADPINIIDESLYADYAKTRVIDAALVRRLDSLLRHSELSGARIAVFTGSVFGAIVEATRRTMRIPVLASYEAMIEAAFASGSRLCVLTTSPYSMANITEDIARYAERHGKAYTQTSRVLDAARIAFREKGDIREHFRLIAGAVAECRDCDAVLLGQTSMDPAYALIPPVPGRPVLTPLRTTVLKMRRMLSSEGLSQAPAAP